MSVQENPYPLRLDVELMRKIRHIASKTKRSVNKEIEYAMELYVDQWEKANGPIPPLDD